ncbi:MAG: LysM domain-containing protein [Pedobacter sp.]|nr:MAG: LysM domain-containing protein [Pedobacter sp.]
MTDISRLFLQQAGLKVSAFAPNSRYNGIETGTIEDKNGEPVAYVKRRFVPAPASFFLLQKHIVSQGERPDLLAQQYYNDPEKFWQIADANAVLDADEIVDQPGKSIHITLPNGIPGNSHA